MKIKFSKSKVKDDSFIYRLEIKGVFEEKRVNHSAGKAKGKDWVKYVDRLTERALLKEVITHTKMVLKQEFPAIKKEDKCV